MLRKILVDRATKVRNNAYPLLRSRFSHERFRTVAGKKTLAITDRQYSILQILWEHGSLTVRELMQELPGGDKQPYTTVLGMLQNMEKAGLVNHDSEGTTYRYSPAVSERETTGKLLRDFVSRFFGGSPERLVQGLVDAEELSADDLRELEGRLGESGRRQKASRKSKQKP